ncbi:ATP-binding protein, partial [Acidianus sp. DSM 29099]|nr:ATP-binding protein [Acidianus sp. RZ1]
YNSINISEIINNPVIIDFSKIPTLEIRYILIDTILRSILSYMYVSGQSKLRKMIVIDEAHFVLSKESGLQLMEKLFAEGRKFGFGFILISQTSEYVKKLIPNSAYIFVLNMIEPGELEYISKLLGGSDMDIYKAIYNSLLRLPKGLIITRDILQDEIVLVRSS